MAYISQEHKKSLAPAIKAVCKKYGVNASLSVGNHSTLVLNVKSGKIDFIGNSNETCSADVYQCAKGFTPDNHGYMDVNPYHYKSHFSGKAKKFLSEVFQLMNNGNHDNSDAQTDYFDVGWYTRINIGKWDKKYEITV